MPQLQGIGKNILIVDNSHLIIERLISILRDIKEVVEIRKATDFEKAVEVLAEKKTDIVLMDVQLSGKKGLELLKYIVQSYPEIAVIVLTNQVSVYYQKLCKELGARFFIDKSKDFDRIPEIILSA